MSAQSLKPSFSSNQQNTAFNTIIYTTIKIMYIINDRNSYAMLSVLKTVCSFVGQNREKSSGKDIALYPFLVLFGCNQEIIKQHTKVWPRKNINSDTIAVCTAEKLQFF